jgi:hypothetical protein
MEEEKRPEMPQESDIEASMEAQLDKEASAPQYATPPFPEGGLRAWSVAIGCSGVMFSTFGYVNAFGYSTFGLPSFSCISNSCQGLSRVLPNPPTQS